MFVNVRVVSFSFWQCDPAVGMKAFFDMIDKQPKKLVLFGAACNAVTDPIAKASQFFQLVQVSSDCVFIRQSFSSQLFLNLSIFLKLYLPPLRILPLLFFSSETKDCRDTLANLPYRSAN